MSGIPLSVIVYGNWVSVALAVMMNVPARNSDEGKLLPDSFGKEWEEYHCNTSRLVPFVFRCGELVRMFLILRLLEVRASY